MVKASTNGPVIGILALQGDFDKHRTILEESLDTRTVLVRTPEQLTGADALILPGGESTTIAKLIVRNGLDVAIRERAGAGMPVYGTCAGMILMAREIDEQPEQPTLGLLDISVARNAFGRQIDSFEADVSLKFDVEDEPVEVRGVFIRAPYVTATGPEVAVLAMLRERIVAVRQGSLLATAFHPELTGDPRVHAHFLSIVSAAKSTR